MAELLLVVTDEQRPPNRSQDGDVLCAFNDRQILCCHAQHICHPKRAERNGSGLIVASDVLARYHEATAQYRFQRVSATEVERIELATGNREVFGPKPNARGELIDVRLFLRRRRRHPRHHVFGEDGAEYWYGGRTDHSPSAISRVWDAIEQATPHRRVEFPRWPLGSIERRHYLPVMLDSDIDDVTVRDLVAPEIDDTDPEHPVVVAKRTHRVAWRDTLGVAAGDVSRALDPSIEFEVAGRHSPAVTVRKAITAPRE